MHLVPHLLQTRRLYYSQITVNPQKSIDYVQQNCSEKVVYRNFATNTYNDIGVGASFNHLSLINSNIVHPTGVLTVPCIGAVANSGLGGFQSKSCFDTCPAIL